MAFTLETTLGELLDNPQAKALLDQQLPGLSTNPLAAMAKGMSLKAIAPMAKGMITPDKLKSIEDELKKI